MTKKEQFKERERINRIAEYLEMYLQIACEDGCDMCLLNKFMLHPSVITQIPLHNERLKELAAKIYVYYQALRFQNPEIMCQWKNGYPIVKVKIQYFQTPF
jgi:hypothetical protein